MEKIKIKVEKLENVKFKYAEYDVEVVPYIDLQTQATIIEMYINALFHDGKEGQWDMVLADFVLSRTIVDKMTNIAIDEMDISELDSLFSGKLYEMIIDSIINYETFLELVQSAVKIEIEKWKIQETSVKFISSFMTKMATFLNNIQDIAPEDIEKFKKEAEEIGKIITNSPIAPLIAESKNHNKPIKRKAVKKEYVQ